MQEEDLQIAQNHYFNGKLCGICLDSYCFLSTPKTNSDMQLDKL